MAARGHAGGLASTSTAAAAVLDAAGFDLILIETVGTGQSEVEVAAAADTTVVLEAPEMGDEVQAIKAGLLEVADIVVVNKGDRPGAQRTASQLRAMLVAVGRAGGGAAIREPGEAGASARPSAGAIASEAEGARGAAHDGDDRRRNPGAARVAGSASRARSRGGDTPARLARAEAQVWAILADRLRAELHAPANREATDATMREVAAHELDPFAAADRLLAELR